MADETGDVMVFKDDDDGYLKWLDEHPLGFVINCDRNPRRQYLKLHKSRCHTISGTPTWGKDWTVQYLKVCSDARQSLRAWAQDEVGGVPDLCGFCNP